jgi:hypothetical protein
LTSLPRFTISDWSAGKYGIEKSTVLSRSGVIGADEATIENLPWASSRKMVSKVVFLKVAFVLIRFATSFTMSTSNPR